MLFDITFCKTTFTMTSSIKMHFVIVGLISPGIWTHIHVLFADTLVMSRKLDVMSNLGNDL